MVKPRAHPTPPPLYLEPQSPLPSLIAFRHNRFTFSQYFYHALCIIPSNSHRSNFLGKASHSGSDTRQIGITTTSLRHRFDRELYFDVVSAAVPPSPHGHRRRVLVVLRNPRHLHGSLVSGDKDGLPETGAHMSPRRCARHKPEGLVCRRVHENPRRLLHAIGPREARRLRSQAPSPVPAFDGDGVLARL